MTDEPTERLLSRLGARFEWDPKLRLDRIDPEISERDQYRLLVVDQPTVDRYAADMANGDQFPPIVVRQVKNRLVIVSGMHRYRAARQIEHPHLPAYIITCPDNIARLVSFEDNATHGLALAASERATFAARLVRMDGLTYNEAATAVRVSPARVGQAVLDAEAIDRARALDPPLDLDVLGGLAPGALGRIEDDYLFEEACRLAISHRYNATKAQALARQLIEAADPVDALDAIAERSTLQSTTHRGGGRRNERERIVEGCYRILECAPDDVVEYLMNDDQAWVLASLLHRTAKHLMRVHKQVEAAHGSRPTSIRSAS